MSNRGELAPNEPHPAVKIAKDIIGKLSVPDLMEWQESFASCAIEGNRMGEVCSETIRRILSYEPVSDRYLMGLALVIMKGREE